MLNHAAMRRPDNSVSDMGMRLFEHKEPLNPPVNEHYPYYMIDHIVQYIYRSKFQTQPCLFDPDVQRSTCKRLFGSSQSWQNRTVLLGDVALITTDLLEMITFSCTWPLDIYIYIYI